MQWFVYIAESIIGRYYTGVTTNPERRLKEHNSGKGCKFAHDQGSLKLVYISNAFPDKSSAWKREIQIKGWSRWKKEKLITGEWK